MIKRIASALALGIVSLGLAAGTASAEERQLNIYNWADYIGPDTIKDFEKVKDALVAAGLNPELAEVTMRAENTIELAGDDAQRMQKLLDVLEDLDDVQEVYHNAEIGE